MKKLVALSGATLMVLAGAVAVPAASADSGEVQAANKKVKCWKKDGTFRVVHNGDRINRVKI
jgi:hypothetical protein